MKQLIITTFILFVLLSNVFAQRGTLTATFTLSNGQTSTISITKPFLRYDDPNGYWFVDPHNGDRHFTLNPDRNFGASDAAFIDLNEKQNDIDLFYYRDSSHISFSNKKYAFMMPEWDNSGSASPLHFHINTFTNSEIAFSFSGSMRCQENKDGAAVNSCTVTGTGHFYREAKFLRSDVMPGCNCDATIYPIVYDEENNIRSASQCELALRNKIFITMQKTFAPVFANVGTSEKGKMAPGDISVTILPGHTNINVPPRDPDHCNTAQQYGVTGFNAQKKYYNNEDGYGIRLIKMPTDEQLGIGSKNAASTEVYTKKIMAVAAISDSLIKLYTAKKITLEEYQKKVNENAASLTLTAQSSNDAFEIAKVETDLSIQVFLNPDNEEMMLMKVSDKNRTVVEHTIKGAAFEIWSPSIKDNDGTYLLNKKFIYFGKFTAPGWGRSGGGFDAKITKAVYPVNGNKLSVYDIIIRLEGSADMIDKAIANMDLNALQELITKQ